MKEYDLAIIGSGPGGYVSAIRAGQLGLKTAVIEKAELGGVCLNWGCIPTKSILRNAEVLSLVKRAGGFGIDIDGYTVDYTKAVDRAKRVVKRLTKGIEFLLKKNNVELIHGEGTLLSADTVGVKGSDGEIEVKARAIIISTGSRPMVPDGIEIDHSHLLDSNNALYMNELPKDIVIVGGGAIGVEFAYILAVYGVKVTIVEAMPQLLPGSDGDVAEILSRSFNKMGVEVITGSSLKGVVKGDGRLKVKVASDNSEKELSSEKVLIAIGRKPNSEGLGIDRLGIEMDRGVFIKTDEFMETSIKGIFAIGDVTSPPLLAHKAMAEGILAVERIAGKEVHPIDRLSIPMCIYTEPQIASIGLTKERAEKEGYKTKVSTFPFRASGKALAMDEAEGFVKVIADRDTEEILGVHMIGPEVTELIGEVALARLLESTAMELNKAIHPHPTLSEALMEAAGGIFGGAIHI